MQQSPELLNAELTKLPSKEREKLTRLYRDGIIKVEFRGVVNLAERRKALPLLWRILADQPPSFEGKVDLYDSDAPDAIQLIWVNRGRTPGDVTYFGK